MNKWILMISLIIFQACGQAGAPNDKIAEAAAEEEAVKSEASQVEEIPEETEAEPEAAPSEANPLLGYYVGTFYGVDIDFDKNPAVSNKITIAIDSIGEDELFGHSVVAGNNRPFSGPISKEGDNIKVEAKEPGDNRYDGVFTFTLSPATNNVTGTWQANNKKLAVSKREYNLDKRVFSYDPNLALPEDVSWSQLYEKHPKFEDREESLTEDVLSFNASNEELKKEDIENMYKGDLEVMRNAIYARHGYSFKNRKMRFIFDSSVDWYMPVSTDIRDDLTDLERKNIDLLKRYEEHAGRYYDVFGR